MTEANDTLIDDHSRSTVLQPGSTAGLEGTLAPAASGAFGATSPVRRTTNNSARTTVLPRWSHGAVLPDENLPRYERLRPLGEGGIGEVVLAKDHDIDRSVAIKRLRPDQRNTGSLLRFAQEVRTVGRLEHPNIVPVHDVGIDDEGQHYFVMKYVEGETLETVIEKLQAGSPEHLRRFPVEVRSQVFLGILRAVQYAHSLGIVHRDIKPANIMVGPYGEVMLMDWGIAKQLRAPADRALPSVPEDEISLYDNTSKSIQTQHGTLMGTPAYMAPEQARGETDKIDERSDVYALSVLFHEFVTLRHYLDAHKTVESMLAYVASAGSHERSISEWVLDASATGAPMELVHFIRKGMAADPAARFANAAEMAQELEDILAGKMKMQCHISATKRVMHSLLHAIDRHVMLASVALMGTVAAALVGVLSLVRWALH